MSRTEQQVEHDLAMARRAVSTEQPGAREACERLQAELDEITTPPTVSGPPPQSGKVRKEDLPAVTDEPTNVVVVSADPVSVEPAATEAVKPRRTRGA